MMRPKPASPRRDDMFSKPVPGWSLTQPAKKWPWESSPKHAVPGDAVDEIVDKLEQPQVNERYAKLMFAGVSIEELVSSITMAGFMEGRFSPDVAEIIKGPLALWFLGFAAEREIPARLFADEASDDRNDMGLGDPTILSIMKVRNPRLFNALQNYGQTSSEEVGELPDEASFFMQQEDSMMGLPSRIEMQESFGVTPDDMEIPESPEEEL